MGGERVGKVGEITLTVDKDFRKDAKVSLNDLFSGKERGRKEIAILEDVKKAAKVKVTIETV
jgi:RNA-binding protein YlmH